MTDSIHADDRGTTIYLDVLLNGASLGTSLSTYTTRTVHLRRPLSRKIITITAVPVAVDPVDGVTKLTLTTGTSAETALTGVGNFAVPVFESGTWVGDVVLGNATSQWTSDEAEIFDLKRNIA